jgi:hypothetical protein
MLDMLPIDVSVRGQSYIQKGVEDVAFVSSYTAYISPCAGSSSLLEVEVVCCSAN